MWRSTNAFTIFEVILSIIGSSCLPPTSSTYPGIAARTAIRASAACSLVVLAVPLSMFLRFPPVCLLSSRGFSFEGHCLPVRVEKLVQRVIRCRVLRLLKVACFYFVFAGFSTL